MEKENKLNAIINLFEGKEIRSIWDSEKEDYYFSVVDVINVLANPKDASDYWTTLKRRLSKEEGSEIPTKCRKLKMKSIKDGKNYPTDTLDTEGVFRLIESVPSPKAEPFKLWLAQVGAQRIDQLQDPELSIQQAMADYRRLGYSEEWVNQRLKSIDARKELTDEWKRTGVAEGKEYALLTDIITRQWSGLTTKQYKQHKGLRKENLRDNMTTIELALNTLAEASTAEISKQKNPRGLKQNMGVAQEGGQVANVARRQLENTLGRGVISSAKASDYVHPLTEGENE